MLETVLNIIVASDDSDGIGWLLAMGPAGATAFYWAVWRAYRNTDKSHGYEHETRIEVSNLTGTDVKVGTNNGTTERFIRGRNSDNPRQRL